MGARDWRRPGDGPEKGGNGMNGAGTINAMLCLVLVMGAVAAALVWWSPKAAQSLSQLLLARAVALRASREVYWERFDELWGKGDGPRVERLSGVGDNS